MAFGPLASSMTHQKSSRFSENQNYRKNNLSKNLLETFEHKNFTLAPFLKIENLDTEKIRIFGTTDGPVRTSSKFLFAEPFFAKLKF